MISPMHAWARWIAQAHGLRVFPIPPGCKAPGALGIRSATADLAQIDAWWAAMPDANIGVTGCLRIDPDTKHGGLEAWRALEAKHGAVRTLTATTPRGGLHLYFRTPQPYGNSTGSLPAGIDVRGHETGYTVAPPSSTIATPDGSTATGRYEFIDATAPIADAPQWLLELIGTPALETATRAPTSGNLDEQQRADLLSALLSPGMLADWGAWSDTGLALLSLGEVGRELFEEFSAAQIEACPDRSPGDDDAASRWDRHARTRPVSDYRSIFKRASERGWANPLHDLSRIPFSAAGVPAHCKAPTAPQTTPTDERPAPTEADPRPVIELRGGELHNVAERCEGLLSDAVYVHGSGRLVRIGMADDPEHRAFGETKREAAQAVCISASAQWVRRALMGRARFIKWDKRAKEYEDRDCPADIADNIVSQEGWASFRKLVAISPVPVLRGDMSLWTQPGYDAATGVYHHPTLHMPHIPEAPTRQNALVALARLRAPFAEFPYASPEAEAVFLAHVLTSVLRTCFDTSPVFVYTSPIAATGKTLLADMPGTIAHGVTPAHSPWTEGEELKKVLFAALLSGDASLTIDNVPNGQKVRAPALCNFVTSAVVADRVLGLSERRSAPNRCTVVMTGNNVTPVSDLARRSLVCRLDANTESARGRSFTIRDLRGHVRSARAQMIVDALTVVRAYHFAGRPDVAHPLESFEHWSRIARDPLVWLGVADPIASQQTETDDELAPLAGAFVALAAVMQGEFTAAQLSVATLQPALRDALIGAGCSEPADVKKLGFWLREVKDRIAAGCKLERHGTQRNGAATWRLKTI